MSENMEKGLVSIITPMYKGCLLYTSDAADEL